MGIEDKNFELLLSQKKHKELIKKLDSILKELMNTKKEDLTIDLSGIEKSIEKINIKSQGEDVPKAILALSDVIVSKIQALETKQISEWTFDIKRDNEGYIDTVKASGK